MLRLTRFAPSVPSNDTARLALTQWTRAAGQRNIDALVKVGDYYYHGLGVSGDETESSRLEKAANCYQSAADTQLSALAVWNLGWMYENGVGVPQDYHLAKRHYDLALDINSDAYVPVTLSLFKLYARSIWHTLRGGKDGLNLWNSDEEDKGEFEIRVAAWNMFFELTVRLPYQNSLRKRKRRGKLTMAKGKVMGTLSLKMKTADTTMMMMDPGTWERPKRISTAVDRVSQIVEMKTKIPSK